MGLMRAILPIRPPRAKFRCLSLGGGGWGANLFRLCRMRHKRHYSACRIMPNLGVQAGDALAW